MRRQRKVKDKAVPHLVAELSQLVGDGRCDPALEPEAHRPGPTAN